MKKAVDEKKLLETATRHFAEFGFEGARMDKIADEAGVNKASIYYRIGNKDALYEKVLNTVVEIGTSRLEEIIQSPVSAEEKLTGYISQLAGVLRNTPQMAKLFLRLQLSQGRNMPESFPERIVRLLDGLSHILKQGEKQGRFHPVDTLTIHFMIYGSLSFHLTSSPIRLEKQSFQNRYQPEPGVLPQTIVDNVICYVLRAVKKES